VSGGRVSCMGTLLSSERDTKVTFYVPGSSFVLLRRWQTQGRLPSRSEKIKHRLSRIAQCALSNPNPGKAIYVSMTPLRDCSRRDFQ
jgi:hypothetical protein